MELIIVTGLSGAGKSNALNCLEDMGYYCIDNMPPALIGSFIDLAKTNKLNVDKAAICIDSRSGEGYRGFDQELNKYQNMDYKIMFLEASDETLIRRFNETRRNHPLNASSVKDGIRRERAFLAKARSISNYVIDTSNMKTAKLKEVIKDIVMKGEEKQTFIINIQSFGYKHGMPLDADMVFDMRFIPNPYYVPSLKELTGNSMKVKNYVLRQQVTVEFMEKIVPLLEEMIPAYMQEGKYHLNIACGCTGGHHRSVASANELARIFREKGYRITIAHRDL